ncbi:MAG: Coenzyme F420 hydrogenase/dehydrogenase, beta subunit C-terminal domain [Thermodesulfobacteriota bacterium]|nr:Coenzyme F420 hydrogenase/dehydrogenase, beta subunit C-terminal domain [Thermodesulfobacteriota bacterium]
METNENEIRLTVKKLFDEDKIDILIGYSPGTLPLRTSPVFLRKEDDVEVLVWNSFCENTLSNYLKNYKDKRVGIVAKGCDSRLINLLLLESQVKKENLVVIGVPCRGVIDRKKIDKITGGMEVTGSEEKEDGILIFFDGTDKKVTKADILHDSCMICNYKNAVSSDIFIGEKEKEEKVDPYNKIREMEENSTDERWNYFNKEIEKCIRCYACRNVCPMCYCQECFVDCTDPEWFGKTAEIKDTKMFHIVRAYHMAGRCVDCGACVKACPMDVDLRFLTKKIEKDVLEFFAYEAGVKDDEPPPFTTFKPEDPQEFIR